MIRKIIEKLYFRYLRVDIEAQSFSDIERKKVFDDLRDNDEYRDLLRSMVKGDIQRYFNAGNENMRQSIKGEYRRTIYLLRAMQKREAFTFKVEKPDTKIAGRYT